jgi:hypothetical protein
VTIEPGTHVVTLRFDAGLIRLTRMEGPFELRNLELYSLGTNTLFQRSGYGMDVRTDALRVEQMTQLAELPPAVEGMMDEGLLER